MTRTKGAKGTARNQYDAPKRLFTKPAQTKGATSKTRDQLRAERSGRGIYDRFVKSSLSFEENVSLSIRVATALELGLTESRAELIELCKRAGTNGEMMIKKLEAL